MTGAPPRALPLADLASLVDDASPASGEELAMIGRADELSRRSRDRLHELVGLARARGVSWQSIGEALGVSRQAAFKRFGRTDGTADGPEATRVDVIDRTREVFRLLDAGDYEAVRAQMSYACARALSKRRLMGAWSEVVAATGRLEACTDPVVQPPDGPDALSRLANRHLLGGPVVQTTLRHETGEWIGRIAYNGAGRITGILVAPPGSRDLPF